MNTLQKSLFTNLLFSSTSGFLLIFLNATIARAFAVEKPIIFLIVGIGLLIFSMGILIEIKKQNPIRILVIITLDLLWVAASILFLIITPLEISRFGNTSIALVAGIVLLIAYKQAKALSNNDIPKGKKLQQLYFERVINKTKATIWQVIADVGNYHKYAMGLEEVTILSGNGEGMIRKCSHAKGSWTETCTLWKDKEIYTFDVNTSAPDYPFSFIKTFRGTWKIESITTESNKLILIFEIQYKKYYHQWLLHPFLIHKFKKNTEKLLDNWQNEIERNS